MARTANPRHIKKLSAVEAIAAAEIVIGAPVRSEDHIHLTYGYMRLYNASQSARSPMRSDAKPGPAECNCYAVRAAARHVTQAYDQFLAPSGLRTTQFAILANLRRKGPLTINALAEELVMDRTTLGRNILPLQRDGLISIRRSATDGRAKDLHLTKPGEQRLQAAVKGWAAAQERFESTYGARRAADLRAMLRAVVASELTP